MKVVNQALDEIPEMAYIVWNVRGFSLTTFPTNIFKALRIVPREVNPKFGIISQSEM